jgi:NAD(P)-dependent dehydrogenase (short-subunit alcohol dehydrogenase family)
MKIEIQKTCTATRSNRIAPNNSLRVFEGASAIVTGGASGIGRALGSLLAERGCTVCLADRQLDMVVEAAAEIRSGGGNATAAHIDVSNYSCVERVVREMQKRTGRLDYMFNNEDWKQIVDVNLLGVINGVQAAYQVMLQQGFGHIVNTASMAGLLPAPGAVAYATTKHAVVGLSRSLRAEAAARDIRVSALCPGAIRTPILQGGGKYGKSYANLSAEQERRMWDKLRPMSPDTFVARALDAVARNKAIIVIPSWWRLIWYADRLFPSLAMALARKSYRDVQALGEGQARPAQNRWRYTRTTIF